MANVQLSVHKKTDKWRETNRWAKDYMPPIYQCGGIIKDHMSCALSNKG